MGGVPRALVSSFLVAGLVPAGQPDEMACRRVTAAVMSAAQGQRSARWSRRRRPLLASRAATANSRRQGRLDYPLVEVHEQVPGLPGAHEPAGQAVTPRMRTVRVWVSITNKTYTRRSTTVST